MHNHNVVCSNYRCGFSLRRATKYYKKPPMEECPLCESEMLDIGYKCRLPKVSTKKRKNLLKTFFKKL